MAPPDTVSLRDHYDALRVMDERVRQSDRELGRVAREAQDRGVAAALTGLTEATHRADAAYEKRLDLLNEFKSAMSEAQSKFMRRSEMGAWGVAALGLILAVYQHFAH